MINLLYLDNNDKVIEEIEEIDVEAFDENELFQQRICLAGDFNLIYREASSNATGTQPTENWRMF